MINDSRSNPPLRTSRYGPEIDGLRAFAVIAVINYHFNKDILPGGYLGVDIFFVISGYVITSSLFGRTSRSFKDFISQFYERRIKRLIPLLIVYVMTIAFSICLIHPRPAQYLLTGVTALLGVSNMLLYEKSTDYFAVSAALNPFTQTWSLGVEEQFYILFPFLIWFSGFGRQAKNGSRNLALIIGVLAIVSLFGFLYLYPINQSAAYFLMPTRFWEMASGCLVWLASMKLPSVVKFINKVPPSFVFGVIFVLMYLPLSISSTSTFVVVVMASVLITCLKKGTVAYAICTHHAVVYIGLISYSLYLWHWGVLSLVRLSVGLNGYTAPLSLFLVFFLSVVSHRFIEEPFRRNRWSFLRSKTILLGLASNAFAISLACVLAVPNIYRSLYLRVFNSHMELPALGALNRQNCIGHSSFEQAKSNCWIKSSVAGRIRPKKIFFMGDSHNESITFAAIEFSKKV